MPRPKLPEGQRLARKRLRGVHPDNAHKVLSRDIYWTVEFLDVYLERCDAIAFDDPRSGHRLALHAPSLASMIGVGSRDGEYRDAVEKRSYRVLALAVFASTCRRIGERGEAITQYETAFAVRRLGPISTTADAELHCRYGTLQAKNAEPEALDQYRQALRLFALASDPVGIAQTLVLRAGWHWSMNEATRTVEDLGSALVQVAGFKDERAGRVLAAAIGNLTRLACRGLSPRQSTIALREVRDARKQLALKSRSVVKAKLYWIEGSLNREICFHRAAIRLLTRAREGFRQLELPGEFALCSLELAIATLGEGCPEVLGAIRDDTVSTLRTFGTDPLLLDTLTHWRVEATPNTLLGLRQAIHQSMACQIPFDFVS